MKKALVALAAAAFASTASASIAGGSHDLSAAPYNGSLSACQFCHAPHFVNTTVAGAPLWNRGNATGSFTYYTSNTVSSRPTSLNANSMTCMSCHDGVTDMGDTYTGSNATLVGGQTMNAQIASGHDISYANIGEDLTNDHPVSIRYVEGGTLELKATVTTTGGLKLYGTAGTETIECASCHDPHGTSDGAAGGAAFLRASAATLCTICHLK